MNTKEQILNLGWREIGENYYSLKKFDDFSKKEGKEWRLSVFPKSNLIIEVFAIHFGVSGADCENHYGCSDIFHGKITNENDLKTLMGFLEIPVRNLVH